MTKWTNGLSAVTAFGFGIAAASLFLPDCSMTGKCLVSSAAAASTCAAVFLRSRISVLAMLVCAGAFCFISGGLMPDFAVPGPLSAKFEAGKYAVERAIDAVPFSSEDHRAITKALIAGDKSGLTRSVKKDFRDAGAAHLLALSGLHLGIIYTLARWILSFLGGSRAAAAGRSLLIMTVSVSYTLITGASASLCRACLFIWLSELSILLQRPQNPCSILGTALLLQLSISPQSVRDTGFQLSYLAVAGILTAGPVLSSCWTLSGGGAHSPMKRIWDSASVSISAQLLTWPVVLLRFGTFPRHFLLTNLLAIPVTTALIISCITATGLTAIGHCPPFVVRAADFLCSLLQSVLHIISTM
ncbi:MAG: ComEC/Rec2 family competence protein [Bacteroidales bacterium]|nr:ComEC/Rec2 family competence protein [Bacteroidales bacterium]